MAEPSASNSHSEVAELAISRAWHERGIPDQLITTDGRAVRVVHRGTWTHGLGPDFRDAMIEFDGLSLVTGSVEAHLKTSGWRNHGHHADPRYNDVVLHLVVKHDSIDARRLDGATVPTVIVDESVLINHASPIIDWSQFGGTSCAEAIARTAPKTVQEVIWRLGDIRLSAKTARIEARLTAVEPAEVLYQEIWDGLGFSANREPMRRIASTLPLSSIERALTTVGDDDRLAVCRGLLFGIAGFLPMSPEDASNGGISPKEIAEAEDAWRRHGGPWMGNGISPVTWTRARVRPANHPVQRLASGAAILANAEGGLVPTLLDALRTGDDVATMLQKLSTAKSEFTLGEDRARAIVANAFIPFALALAEQTTDAQLSEAAARAWEQMPGAGHNEVTKRALKQVAGSSRVPSLGIRGEQGLIHLDTSLCAPRRCRECPVAKMVVSLTPNRASTP